MNAGDAAHYRPIVVAALTALPLDPSPDVIAQACEALKRHLETGSPYESKDGRGGAVVFPDVPGL